MMIWSHHYQHQTGRSLRQKNGGEHRKASYDSVAEECEERGTTWTRSTIQLSSISVRVCHERCLAAEEYRLYTGFDHVEDDGDDDLVSSLSASNWAGTASKDWRGASKVFLRQLLVRGAASPSCVRGAASPSCVHWAACGMEERGGAGGAAQPAGAKESSASTGAATEVGAGRSKKDRRTYWEPCAEGKEARREWAPAFEAKVKGKITPCLPQATCSTAMWCRAQVTASAVPKRRRRLRSSSAWWC